MSVPAAICSVAYVCLKQWNKIGKQSTGNEKKEQRNPLETNHFSTFFHLRKKQESGDYWRCSVTKPLAGQLPKGNEVTRSGSDNLKRRYIALIVIILHTEERL